MTSPVHATLASIRNLLLPTICFGCDRIGSPLCAPCSKQLAYARTRSTCLFCDQHVPHGICRKHQKLVGIERILTYAPYAHPTARKLVEGHKYRGLDHAASIMANCIQKLSNDISFTPTLIIPIPSTKLRERERGGSHTMPLATPIAKHLHIPVDAQALIRTKHTPSLVRTHSSSERARMLKNAFQTTPNILGKSVLLIDDVVTSGSTLREAAKVLKKGGAKEVAAIVFARA